jgi:D-aminopeptidase
MFAALARHAPRRNSLPNQAGPRIAMKILISTDIEGVAGVFHSEQARPGNAEYERARAWMTGEANAAVVGAYAAGAHSVVVNDSHGGFRNLLPDALDSRAQLVLGKPRYLGMMGGLDTGCDGVFMVGYHCRAQSRGILAHTMNGFAFSRRPMGANQSGSWPGNRHHVIARGREAADRRGRA